MTVNNGPPHYHVARNDGVPFRSKHNATPIHTDPHFELVSKARHQQTFLLHSVSRAPSRDRDVSPITIQHLTQWGTST